MIFGRGAADELQAAAHMRCQLFVDPNRVVFAGFSWGGTVGIFARSAYSAEKIGNLKRFNAAVAFYPPCVARPANGSPSYHMVLPNIDRPLLVPLGGRDEEIPPKDCISYLEQRHQSGDMVD
jgi:dienelactone hydrolase